MKNFFNKNKYFILVFIVIIGMIIFSFIDYDKFVKNYKNAIENTISECKINTIPERQEYCDNILKENINPKPGFYYNYFEIYSRLDFLEYGLFFIVTIPIIYFITKTFKNRHIIYELTRETYKKFKTNLFKKAYLYSLILPLIILIILVATIIYSGGLTLNPYYDQEMNDIVVKATNPYFYVTTIVLRALILGIIYANIALIVSRNNHNFYIAVILSYLASVGTEIILEGVIGRLIFYEIFKIDSMMIYINIVNILSLNLEKGYLCIYLPLILILVVSTFIAKLMYKNKEKLIIDCDKNN